MQKKALVLLSGGLDSVVCLADVLEDSDYFEVAAITFDYGQTTFPEIDKARKICAYWKVPHTVIDITLPTKVDSHKEIPARNLIFISLATGWAIENGYSDIVIGAEPDSTYTDSSIDFLVRMKPVLTEFGKTLTWPIKMLKDKKAVVKRALELGVPLHLCHSSLSDKIDGKCKTSKRYREAVMDVVGNLFSFEKLMQELSRLRISVVDKSTTVFYRKYRLDRQETLSFKLAPALFCLSAYHGDAKETVDVYSTGNWSKAIKYVEQEAHNFGTYRTPPFKYTQTDNIPLLLNQELSCASTRAEWGMKQALSLLPRPRYARRLACRVVQGHLANAAQRLGYIVVSPRDQHDILLLTDI
jgi:7-cyano-7-deazaguanine synthase